jgi:hypothetical protein
MSKPYGVMADLHAHSWSAFGSTNATGVNSRLAEILNEVDRCCAAIQELGGHTVVIAGDVFHVRGSVAPSVFNPVRDCLASWVVKGTKFKIIPGNHDLEGKHTQRLTSAVAMLEAPGVEILHGANGSVRMGMAFLPWIPKQSDLLTAIGDLAAEYGATVAETDLFIHAGIDGVLKGMPEHGLTAEKLAEFGFRRVFAGHYHHHAELAGGMVYSVGATTHQTWGDIGTKAGWLIVDDASVRWMASHAPNFIEITGEEDETDLSLKVDGHYVRARIGSATAGEVAAWREKLTEMGARGVLVQSVPVAASAPRGGVSASLHSLEVAVADYAAAQGFDHEVGRLCTDILAEVRV